VRPVPPAVESRARASLGASGDPVYRMVAAAVASRHPGGGTLVDVGCGGGALWPHLRERFDRYVGIDAVRYPGFPEDGEFHRTDLDAGEELPAAIGDVVAGVETIEHLENPRAFVRLLTRLACPGGLIAITTPNQHSLLSRATFLVHGEHNAFRTPSYPAHLTALLEADLRRIATENALGDVELRFSGRGRMPGTARHWPAALSRLWPRSFSDNIMLVGRAPR
jgi:2-polyprenyl-3-methyl-5-hydroxy-6-metoxy-1,4-benzoquinol methylase